MAIQLMYITNNPQIAIIAESCGVDRLWVDLEWMGKEKRQRGMDTVKSAHTLDDITNMKKVLKKSTLMVRVNPIHNKSQEEISETINRGADLVMLPMWKSIDEVKKMIDIVDGRAKVNLLLETKEAYDILPQIVNLKGIDEIHVGLNDLHLSYNMKFMFQLLANGTVDNICNLISKYPIAFGFGGIGRIGGELLPAEHILSEHIRLGSSMVILSRSFCNTKSINDLDKIRLDFEKGIVDIRTVEKKFSTFSEIQLHEIHNLVKDEIEFIVSKL